jgi:hypothetical protein
MIDYAEDHNQSFGSFVRQLVISALDKWVPAPPQNVNAGWLANRLHCWPCIVQNDSQEDAELDYFFDATCEECGREIVGLDDA